MGFTEIYSCKRFRAPFSLRFDSPLLCLTVNEAVPETYYLTGSEWIQHLQQIATPGSSEAELLEPGQDERCLIKQLEQERYLVYNCEMCLWASSTYSSQRRERAGRPGLGSGGNL